MYYVYEHLLDNYVFYVGMGNKNRPYDMICRNNKWKEFVKNRTNDVKVNIIFRTECYDEALNIETERTFLRIKEGYDLCQTKAGKKFRKDIVVKIKQHTEEHRHNLSKSMTGRKLSLEHRHNISVSNKGKHKGISHPAWNKGIPMTNEVKEKISKTIKEKYSTEEMKQKLSNAQKGNHNKLGKKLTMEQRKRISEKTKEGMRKRKERLLNGTNK